MRLVLTFGALFASVILLQLGAGGVGPLDALSGLTLGFSREAVGLLGSAHFLGFFLGCWWAPRLMGTIGHSRTFATFAALGTIGVLAHMMIVSPLAWAGLRVAIGLCVAGTYTVIEAWLNGSVTNQTRGRTMGVYRLVDMGGSLAAQLVIAVLEPAVYLSYNLLALLLCAALLPITLSRVPPPETPRQLRLRPALGWDRSPLAAAGVVVAGLTTGAFRMVGPVYGVEVGLRADQIAFFLAAFVLGGALGQYPAGWLADRYDRRWVLIALSVAAIAASSLTVALSTGGTGAVLLAAGAFGLTTFPIYSVAAAHAHDFASQQERVELSAALLFFYAIGAIASPYVTSALISGYGPRAMFVFIAAAHLVLIVFGLVRMRARPTAPARTEYVYAPRTSFLVGRLLPRRRRRR